MENIVPDIPRIYTALAEWAACFVFVLLLKKRAPKWKTAVISAAALFIQIIFMEVTGSVKIYFWLPCMIIAIALMIGYIYGCCEVYWLDAAYLGILAFVTAEFSASLEWQIVCFFYPGGEHMPVALKWGILFIVLGLVNGMMWKILHSHLAGDGRLGINYREYFSALTIGAAVFVISNLSFLTRNTPFSGQYSFEIANIRTLVDLGGIAMLYAHLIQCSDIRMRRELEAMQNVLQNQYLQYIQSKESIDLINYKYHDLKHQIEVLRSEEDPQKRNAFLNKMEEEIRLYEVQNKTGNKVLDTDLTKKGLVCAKNDITFTCVADGTLVNFMETADICSIFGNALDNAIECEKKIADKEKRLIHVTVSRQKNFLMIRVENYFEGNLRYKEGALATTKKNKAFHGYGIKSIRYTANKYEGALSISTRDSWFELQVLIPMQEGQKVSNG